MWGNGAGETGLEKLVEGRSRQKKANARAQVPARGKVRRNAGGCVAGMHRVLGG